MSRRAKIKESTISQDLAILRQFECTMNKQTSDLERRKLRGLEDRAEDILFALPYFVQEMEDENGRNLAPATRERYLVAIRRYLRFKRVPQPVRKIKGPYLPKAKRGGILHADDLNAWIDSFPPDDDRLAIATWLLLARVPVGSLHELAFGREIRISDGSLELVVEGMVYEVPEQLETLLLAASENGHRRGPVFVSRSPKHELPGMLKKEPASPWQRPAMSQSGLGHFWAAAR